MDGEPNREDLLKWDGRFRTEQCVLGLDPSVYLSENIDLIKNMVPGRRALDIACGEGRNSIFLARHGFDVLGLDISDAGLQKARAWMERERLKIDFRRQNLENYSFTESFDLIININFLLRDMIPLSVEALNPGGVLVFDTLLDSPYVPHNHNKEYLLAPGELTRIFRDFEGAVLLPEERFHDSMPTAKLIFHKK